MPRYRFTPNPRPFGVPRYAGFGPGGSWVDNVSKGRVLHYAAWHDCTFEQVGGRSAGGRRRRGGYSALSIPRVSQAGGLGAGLSGLEVSALLMSLIRRRRRSYTGGAQ